MSEKSTTKAPVPKSKRFGCLKWLGIIVFVYLVCSAYQNWPGVFCERRLGAPVQEDSTNLKGRFHVYLNESLGWFRFDAPPERIAQIVGQNEMISPT